ncbi:MAG: hypothetical protein IPM16_12375 [Chloroflexi bacterium]|nr:hypothetical protein [Chloroflexota bacterium]
MLRNLTIAHADDHPVAAAAGRRPARTERSGRVVAAAQRRADLAAGRIVQARSVLVHVRRQRGALAARMVLAQPVLVAFWQTLGMSGCRCTPSCAACSGMAVLYRTMHGGRT